MQMRWYFAYNYNFQKWEVQYYYRPEFGGHIQNFYFPVNFELSGLNYRKRTGTQEDIIDNKSWQGLSYINGIFLLIQYGILTPNSASHLIQLWLGDGLEDEQTPSP